jgi:hypothetical protein
MVSKNSGNFSITTNSKLTTTHSDVLEILNRLPQRVFEANGYAVVLKIRDIGAAYLAELESEGFTGEGGSHDNVQLLLKTLESLDFTPVITESPWRHES